MTRRVRQSRHTARHSMPVFSFAVNSETDECMNLMNPARPHTSNPSWPSPWSLRSRARPLPWQSAQLPGPRPHWHPAPAPSGLQEGRVQCSSGHVSHCYAYNLESSLLDGTGSSMDKLKDMYASLAHKTSAQCHSASSHLAAGWRGAEAPHPLCHTSQAPPLLWPHPPRLQERTGIRRGCVCVWAGEK